MLSKSINDPGLLLQFGVGMLVVLLYARDRFESPGPVRWTTTFTRYWLARTGYMASLLLVYLLLGGAFIDAKPVLSLLMYGNASLKPPSASLPGPLFAALLLTSLLPHVPYLKKFDEIAKGIFQRMGNIPMEVRVFSAQLERAKLVPVSHMLESAYGELGVKAEWLQLPENRLTYWWARIGLMHAIVNNWDANPTYLGYACNRKTSLDDINRRVEQFLALNAIGPNGVAADEQPPNTPVPRSVSREIEEIHRSLCDFIAGGLLHCVRGARQRQHLLNELGFQLSERQLRPAMSIHHVFLIGGILFLLVLFVALLFQQFLTPGDLPLDIRVWFMIPILYCTSIVIAIYTKSAWRFADIREVGTRPVMGYAAAAALAVLAAFVIQLLFRFVQGGTVLEILSKPGQFTAALLTNLERWPWYVLTFFTTVAIAWTADNHYESDSEPPWLRWTETLGMAAFFCVLQWITLQLLVEFSPHPERWAGKELQMILRTTLVGACIGFFVPHFYRRSFRQTQVVPVRSPVTLTQAV